MVSDNPTGLSFAGRQRLKLLLAAALLALGLVFIRSREPGSDAERGTAPIRAALAAGAAGGALKIENPLPEALFPRDIAPQKFYWSDESAADLWLVSIELPGGRRLDRLSAAREWRPSERDWEAVKLAAAGGRAVFSAAGVRRAEPEKILSSGAAPFGVSEDAVEAPIFYREVVLPFSEAVQDPSLIRWRLGRVSEPGTPPIVLDNLPVCGNCHSFSADGAVLGMDVDYAEDKGAYAIVAARSRMVLDRGSILSWNDYGRGDGRVSFGLLAQVSPDGRHVVSTIKDRPVVTDRPGIAYSQLFFPVQGVLGIYSRAEKRFWELPGADDPAMVQSNAAWSPDGQTIVFARAPAQRLENLLDTEKTMLLNKECAEFIDGGKKLRYGLYTVPFNGGRGGKAAPLAGASANGRSNYFPKYSPDGRWIVFCKADSFMLLQPDSELYIVPAAGGEARRMRCNLAGLNSWHSWSPNGRWLVFSSKANTPYTQLFLTHVDAEGRDSVPVLLTDFTGPDRAANIPEFVGPKGAVIRRIGERFLDDLPSLRRGRDLEAAGDLKGAEAAYRKALSFNGRNSRALSLLAGVQERRGSAAEALKKYEAAALANPLNFAAHEGLAALQLLGGDPAAAEATYRRAVRINAESASARAGLGDALRALGRRAEAAENYRRALELDPANAAARAGLAAKQ